MSDETQGAGRFGRRRGGDRAAPAAGYDLAGTIQDNVRASVEESVRRVLSDAPPGPAPRAGNGAPPRPAVDRDEPDPDAPADAELADADSPTVDASADSRGTTATEDTWEEPRRRDPAEPFDAREEPPSRPAIAGPLESFLRHPFVTLLPLLLLVAGAVAIGVARDPEYTARSRIAVGNSSVPTFYLQTVVIGNQQLASTYARVIGAAPVAIAAAKKTGISPNQAARDLSASPVAASTLIQVEAKGASARYTVALANAGAESLIDYIGRATGTGGDARKLFRQFKRAQRDTRDAEQHVQDLLKDKSPSSRRLARARLEEDTARLRASDLSNRYRAARSDAAQASRLNLLAPASKASSDRRDVLEGLIAIAAVGGLVLGLALALFITNWPFLRSLRPR